MLGPRERREEVHIDRAAILHDVGIAVLRLQWQLEHERHAFLDLEL
jgi:hypothetical protein